MNFQRNGDLPMAQSDELPEHVEWTERKDEQVDRLAALYGLTPKVETAIIDAVQAGNARQIRSLVAPLHPADQADLLERMPVRTAGALVRFLGDHLDAETLTYLDENRRDSLLEIMGAEALARQLNDLSTDDAVEIIEELEDEALADVLAALSAKGPYSC